MTHTIAPPTLEELNERIDVLEANKVEWADFPNHVHVRKLNIELYCLYAVRDGVGAKRQTELEDANNACIELAAKHGYATGHGDTVGDIMREFNAQIPDRAQSPWMDIETAPKDGTDIIVYRPTQTFGEHIPKVGIDYWMTEKSYGPCWAKSNADCQPTHWMPLPAPPTHNSPPDAALSSQGRGTEET